MKKIDFVIVGGQKCGSTFVHHNIRNHPSILMPTGESTLFEESDFSAQSIIEFMSEYSKVEESCLFGIKRPSYLASEKVATRIYNHNPDAKIIAILRNPFERVKSAYFHYMRQGFIPTLELNKGIKNLVEGNFQKQYRRSEEILAFGKYADGVENYMNQFGQNFLICFFDELKKDKIALLGRVIKFLNLEIHEWDLNILNSKPQSVIYSLNRIRLLRLKNQFEIIYNEEKTRYFLKDKGIIDSFFINMINRLDGGLVAKGWVINEKPAFSDYSKELLSQYYEDDIKKLRVLCGDSTLWNDYVT